MKKIMFVILLVFLAGCSVKNTGKIDYRKAVGKSDIACKENCEEYDKRFIPLDAKDISLGKKNRFEVEKDRVSLHLKTAYIKNMTEILVSDHGPILRGEIAIVANAFEIGKKGEDFNELSFSDLKEGRVVYYDDDVRNGQTINFNNMPIYGPTKYLGNPFAFRLSIIELDSGNQYAKSILDILANVGSKAYPQASPILGLLNNLGSVFFSGDTSDYDFRYTMHFDADGGMPNMNHTYLEAGYYVFVRKENRKEFVKWENLTLNTNDFLLYDKKTKKQFTDETYLVVEINKNIGNKDIELELNNFNALKRSLESLSEEEVENFEKLKSSLIKVAKNKYYKNNLTKAKNILNDLKKNKDLTTQTKKYKANQLIEMIGKSVDKEGLALGVDEDEFQMLYYDDIDYLLEEISKNLVNDVDISEYSKAKFHESLNNQSVKNNLLTLLQF